MSPWVRDAHSVRSLLHSKPEHRVATKPNPIAQSVTPSVESSVEQPEPRDAAQRANSKHQVSEPLQWAAIILSFLLLLTAFYQARTHKQQLAVMSQHLQVTKDTLAETKRIFDLIERPLITARAATIPDMLPNQPLSPTVTFATKGRTIAQALRVTVEIAAERGGQFYPLGFPDRGARPYGGYVPAPDDELPIHGAPVDARTLDREFLGNVLNGQELFFVHGR